MAAAPTALPRKTQMTIHIVVITDWDNSTKCHAFSTKDKAIAFAAQQSRIGLWRDIDQYEVEVDGDE